MKSVLFDLKVAQVAFTKFGVIGSNPEHCRYVGHCTELCNLCNKQVKVKAEPLEAASNQWNRQKEESFSIQIRLEKENCTTTSIKQ